MSDITSLDESSGMSNGEDILAKGSASEASNSTVSHRKRDRGSAECSHKVIEKRRRDRINRCLTELGKIIPIPDKNGSGVKQTHGKLEKAEILEMTVEYIMKMQKAQMSSKVEQAECDVSKQNSNKQQQPENGGFPSSQYPPKYVSCSRDSPRFLAEKQNTSHHNQQDHCRTVEGRQLMTVQPTIEQHDGMVCNDKHLPQATSPLKMSSTLSVLRSRINSRTQEFRGPATNQPEAENGKYQSQGESARETVKQVAACRPEPVNGNMDDNSSTTSSDSFEPQTDSSNSSDSGYRTLPRTISATPLGVGRSSYSIPTYALHPSGTHYIPVLLHPNIPLPPMPLGSLGPNQMAQSGLPSPYSFGYMNGFNPMSAKSSMPFGLSNMAVPSFMSGMPPSSQHMQMACNRRSMQVSDSDANIDICGCDDEVETDVLNSSIGVQTD